MPDVRLGRDESHGHSVADLGVAQRLVEDESEFICRAEAGRALHRTDNNRSRRGDDRIDSRLRLSRMLDNADRMGVGRRPEPLDLVKGEVRSRGDDEIVVVERRSVVEFDVPCRRVGSIRLAPCGCSAIPRLASTGARSTSTSARSRHPTPTQGLDGTKLYSAPWDTTETS
jgi:hypothetical protein